MKTFDSIAALLILGLSVTAPIACGGADEPDDTGDGTLAVGEGEGAAEGEGEGAAEGEGEGSSGSEGG